MFEIVMSSNHIVICEIVHACCSKAIVFSHRQMHVPPAGMQNLTREMQRFVLGTLD